MSSGFRREIILLLTGISLAAIVGWLEDATLEILFLVLAVYIAWNLYNLFLITRWLDKPGKKAPETWGVWNDVFYNLVRLNKRHRKSRKRLATILNRFQQSTQALPYATIVLSDKNEIEWFNPAAGALFNLHQQDDIGVPITRIIRPSVFSRYLREKKFDQALEFKLQTRRLKLNISPFGKGSFLLSAIDVTERRLLDDMRRDFIANASHELRTPLTVIAGYIETMREMKGDCDGLPLDRVEQQTERMRTLLEELMTLTRLEGEEQPDNAEQVDIAALLNDIYNDALTIDKGRHDIKLATEPVSLGGNREELRTAFMNLVTNAIRYTPEHGDIRIFCYTDKQGIHIGVEDKGIGISQQHIGRLTERFYRVDTSRSRESGGTGLGLAIVKHALDRHGGKLHIHSVLGLGSLFRCDFPAQVQTTTPTQVEAD
jgi:two-component system phosphate regulon sensor histidine kinase PhoR